jgi:hypothetical protein
MKTNQILTALLCTLIFTCSAEAARIAVVVDLQNETYTKCVTVSDNADAYKVIRATSLNISWSTYGGALGHGLCGINELGCPATNCYCDSSKYWGFYVKDKNSSNWSYSQTGFDGGASCSEHYCAKDLDMIGLAYGEYGTKPKEYSFSEICIPDESTTTTQAIETTSATEKVSGLPTGAPAGNNTTILILAVLIILAAFGFAGYKSYKKRKP